MAETSARSGIAPTGRRRAGRRPTARVLVVLLAAVVAASAGLMLVAAVPAAAATMRVGAATYTTDPVGPLPSGCGTVSTNPRQYLTATAPSGAVPTNDWWSSLVYKKLNCQYSEVLQAHPATYLPNANGLGFSYPTTVQLLTPAAGLQEYHYPYTQDFTAGVSGLNAPMVKVAGWSDWTVTPSWNDGTRSMTATIGHGLPMTYVTVTGGGAALHFNGTPRIWRNDGAAIGFSVNGHDYAAYAPAGAGWNLTGGTLTSSLAGKDYYTVAVLPTTAASVDRDRVALAEQYGRYAHAAVTGTTVSYRYDAPSSKVLTTYAFATTPREGTENRTVTALYQHQWKSLTGATPLAQQYVSPRGPMKVLAGVSGFNTSTTFRGVLPEVPAVAVSSGADGALLQGYLQDVLANPMAVQKSDTYWSGKGMGRAARIAEIADQVGNIRVRDEALAAIRTELTDWFTAGQGQQDQQFYYDRNWGTLIGYPASYGSDTELNDHHFHYGYFIAAAATLARFDPAWASAAKYGAMVDLLIRDANNYDRRDQRFPYLRDFDIFAGHDWASGHGGFAAGNNQESSSEGMNFANALIQWGQVTGNTAIRDAGIFMYTTQAEAIEQYWFDVDGSTFPHGWEHPAVGMVWGDGGSYATWFSAEPEKIQGINMLPITGGHLYLGYHPDYVRKNYQGIVSAVGGPPRVWQDIIGEFRATGDPDAALAAYRADSSFEPEEGESQAHTFHWIRNLAALGVVDTSVTANNPLAVTFVKNGVRTYVAANVTAREVTVTYSTGRTLIVPPGRTVTAGGWAFSGGSHAPGSGSSTTADPSSPVTTSAVTTVPVTTVPVTTSPATTPTVKQSFSAKFHLRPDGVLGRVVGSAGSVPLNSADGFTRDGTPYKATVFTATGLTASATGGSTSFALGVDSGTSVGNAVQVRVSYDLTGDGTWDRVETYAYFATDPVVGAENYTQKVGTVVATGALGDLRNGAVRVEVWSALTGSGAVPPVIAATSTLTIPFA